MKGLVAGYPCSTKVMIGREATGLGQRHQIFHQIEKDDETRFHSSVGMMGGGNADHSTEGFGS